MKTQNENTDNCNASRWPKCARGRLSGWRVALPGVMVVMILATLASAQRTPVNYQQNGAGQDIGGGVLQFRYTWDSSDGNLEHLGDCQVGENVAYPGGANPFVWASPPYAANTRTPNPTVIWLAADLGRLRDTHSHPDFLRPYRADNFTATQDYRWRCTNVNNNNPTNFANFAGIQIVRTVTNPRANCWVYTITKSGAQAQEMPLPNSGPCAGQRNGLQNAQTVESGTNASGASFFLVGPSTTLHEPVLLQFAVSNSLSEPVSFDLGLNGTANFVVTVTAPDGTTQTRRLSPYGFGASGDYSLNTGESVTSTLLLNQWNDFAAIGDYKVTVTFLGSIKGASGAVLASQPSQDLYLHVGPRDARQLGSIASALADAAIHAPMIDERMAAAQTLSFINDPIAVPQLIRVLNQGTFVEQYAVEGLGRIGNPAAVGALWGAMAHPDPDIRSLTVFTLKTMGLGGQTSLTPMD